MKLRVTNLTQSSILLSTAQSLQSPGEKNATVALPQSASFIELLSPQKTVINVSSGSHKYLLRLNRSSFGGWESTSWRSLSLGEAAIWRAYYIKSSKGLRDLVILPARNLSSFLKDIPDNTHLSDILLPGTHDSLAFRGWPVAQCQSRSHPVLKQLQSGIRVLDVRLAVVNGRLIAYHSIINQRTPFDEVVQTLYDFLRSGDGRAECLVMSIKQEDFRTVSWELFSDLVRREVYSHEERPVDKNSASMGLEAGQNEGKRFSKDMWWLENRVPNLGEARGKIVLFSRFGGDGRGWDHGLEGMGIRPTMWPDSKREGFEWHCKETTVRTQDWYDISTFLRIPEKVSQSVSTLVTDSTPPDSIHTLACSKLGPDGTSSVQLSIGPSSSEVPILQPDPVLPISYSSAYSFPLALAPTIALGFGFWRWGFEGVNARIGRWALEMLAGLDTPSKTDGPSSPLSLRKDDIEKALLPTPGGRVSSMLGWGGTEMPRVSGWLLMDFFHEPQGVTPALVELNFVT